MIGENKLAGVAAPGLLLVLLTALISGVSNFVNFWAVQGTSSDAFIAVRNAAVAVMLVPLALFAGFQVRERLTGRQWTQLATIGFVGGAIPFILFFRGLQMAGNAGAGTATFGYRTLFLMAAVFAIVFLKERVSRRLAFATVLLLAGNALLLSLGAPVWSDGTAYVLGATALWAGEYTVSKHALRDLGGGTVALGRMGFGGIFLLAYLGLTGQFGAVAGFSGVQWQWLLISAILLTGFVVTWYSGLKTTDLSLASAVLVLAFPITWVLGLTVGGASPDPAQAAGMVAIVLGVALAIGLASLKGTWVYLFRVVRSRVRGRT